MHVVMTGATGIIGRAVVAELLEQGHAVTALSRDAERARHVLAKGARTVSWPSPGQTSPPAEALRSANAVVHLMGEPIAQRWTSQAKRRIHDSRVNSTRELVAAIAELEPDARPEVLVSQSATGFYGHRGAEWVDESSEPGSDWLAKLVVAWEREALGGQHLLRVLTTRTGVVLSPHGGALAQMLPFFRLGLGGPVAGGRQYVPWVHLDDVVGALITCMTNPEASGPVNITSPNPVNNTEFSRDLGRALHRPAILPVPNFALHLLYGEMAEVVTTGQRVRPTRLLELGYKFRQGDLDRALEDVLQRT